MNYIQLLKNMDIVSIGEQIAYDNISAIDSLFVQSKTANLKVAVAQLTAGGTIPQMAQVHAFDTEARIGSRASFETLKFEKLLIKEKLNQGESLRYYLEEMGATDDEATLKGFIFNDVNTLVKRVQTRATVMNGELLSTGKITVDENNVNTTIDMGMSIDNIITLTGWATAGTDVIGQLETVIANAKAKGVTIQRAITSSKQLARLAKNTAIATHMSNIKMVPSIANLKTWLSEAIGIPFATIDDVYTTDANGGTTNRVFDEDVITFLPTLGTIGSGLWGVTPEEKELDVALSGFVATTKYTTPDPVAVWTKASGIYLPVIADINKMFIGNIAS